MMSNLRESDTEEDCIETGLPMMERLRLKLPSIDEKGRDLGTWILRKEWSQVRSPSLLEVDC